MPTLKEIERKLGFDPLNPPEIEVKDPWLIDDNTPSRFSVLSDEELDLLYDFFRKRILERNKQN